MAQWRCQPPVLHSPWTLRVPVCRPVTAGRCQGQRLFLHSPWTLRAPACRPVTPCTVRFFLFEEKCIFDTKNRCTVHLFFGRKKQVHSAPGLSSLIVALINPCRLPTPRAADPGAIRHRRGVRPGVGEVEQRREHATRFQPSSTRGLSAAPPIVAREELRTLCVLQIAAADKGGKRWSLCRKQRRKV